MNDHENRRLLRSHRALEQLFLGQELLQSVETFPLRGRTNPAFIGAETQCENTYLDSRAKRLLDVTFAALAVAALCPLLLLIGSGVLATSKGPVLFVQKRGGRGQRSFHILKFRSMHVQSAQASVVQATPSDPRATPLGRFLRRTSLDELPQLFNVLRGEMSIVGPRPHAVEHDEIYGAMIGSYCNRFACKPGVTGLAQVNGYRGATPAHETMARRVAMDLEYIETASLSLDLLIILRTIKTMLTCRNAY